MLFWNKKEFMSDVSRPGKNASPTGMQVFCLKSYCKTHKQIFPFSAGIPHFCAFQIIHSNSLQAVGLRNNSAIPDSLTTEGFVKVELSFLSLVGSRIAIQ